MKAERTRDKALIKKVVSQMWDDVSEDGHNADDYEPDVDSVCWLKVGKYGLFALHPENTSTVEIHAFILKSQRKKHSFNCGMLALDWILKNANQYKKVIAKIPFMHKNVRDFCLLMGFSEEGINRRSHLKNGKLFDQWMMGITDQEIREILK